tara:strand:- start:673 stop:1110 length:438 start_codon:yes stop_codon:yes gene_type:complete
MKKRVIFVGIIIIVLIVALYFTFFYTRKCFDEQCFNSALSGCKRFSYVNDQQDSTWFYKIKWKSGNSCKVNVKLLKIKEGTTDLIKLDGKDMTCDLPFGKVVVPQDDLKICHGLLKEEMQDIIITRLHNYVVDNLGEISEELERV